jgi:hypothetical protein
MLDVKIHGVAQKTRPVACVLDLEGLALMTLWLSSLILITLLSNFSSETIVYVVGVPDSFIVDSFGSDAWTQSFFASGSVRSSSFCFVVIVVKQHMPWDGLSWGQTKYWRIQEREMR